MNASAEQLITEDDIRTFINSGADIILLQLQERSPDLVRICAKNGGLLPFPRSDDNDSGGTSQEGADLQTIRQIALMCKMAGTDLHHIGDSGYNGIALPENILNYSIVIRGLGTLTHVLLVQLIADWHFRWFLQNDL